MTAPARLTPTSIGGLKITKVADLAPHLNMLIYGDPGVGKTRLAASADQVPAMRDVLILDVDGGALSAKEVYPNVQRIRVTTWTDLISVYTDLFSNPDHGFNTLVLDTATEAQKYSMSGIMEKVIAKDAERDPEVPSVREWGITSEQVRRLVRGFRDLPLSFIMTCHLADDKDDKTGIIKKAPDLPGKLKKQIAGFFDVVAYMYVKDIEKEDDAGNKIKEEHRLLMTAATDRITAKDRTDRLPRIVVDPTMEQLYTKMIGDSL